MDELPRVRADHSLARAHVPGDPVDEGAPFAAVSSGFIVPGRRGNPQRELVSIAVGPGPRRVNDRRPIVVEVDRPEPSRGEPIPV